MKQRFALRRAGNAVDDTVRPLHHQAIGSCPGHQLDIDAIAGLLHDGLQQLGRKTAYLPAVLIIERRQLFGVSRHACCDGGPGQAKQQQDQHPVHGVSMFVLIDPLIGTGKTCQTPCSRPMQARKAALLALHLYLASRLWHRATRQYGLIALTIPLNSMPFCR